MLPNYPEIIKDTSAAVAKLRDQYPKVTISLHRSPSERPYAI